jgi:predicted regulator of Ras-like GTPase activity (Roadblock/LC7/MglB family)
MVQKTNDVLKEMSQEISGYLASAVIDADGMTVAEHAVIDANLERISAYLGKLIKGVDLVVAKLNSGKVEDNLLTTNKVFVILRQLPGKDYHLAVISSRETSSLGNLRLMAKIYAEKMAQNLPG